MPDRPFDVDNPDKAEAMRALRFLAEPFRDFPYAKECHRYVPIAAALTLLGRPAIVGACPAFLFDASTRGSGKTLQADAVSLIATGRTTAKMNYPVNDEELEKVLAAYALRGASLVNFDNVARHFGGAAIDRCLTAEDTVELRILGKSEIPTLKWRAVIVATGNNLTLSGDTARRVLMCRLESPLENPEDRPEQDFAHPDLLGWVRSNRPSLVWAGLCVLRAYFVAGRPDMGVKRWGSFGPWSALIPPAIVYAGGEDPMQARPTVEGNEDPEKAALSVVLRELRRFDPSGLGVTAKSLVSSLYTQERIKGQASRDQWEDLREAIEALAPAKPGQPPDTRALGKVLAHAKGRVIGGLRLVAVSSQGGVLKWRVEG